MNPNAWRKALRPQDEPSDERLEIEAKMAKHKLRESEERLRASFVDLLRRIDEASAVSAEMARRR